MKKIKIIIIFADTSLIYVVQANLDSSLADGYPSVIELHYN